MMNIIGGTSQNIKADLVDFALSNPKVQSGMMALLTGAVIDLNIMAWLPQSITMISSLLGVVYFILNIWHKRILIKKDLLEIKRYEKDNS
ncbi:MAG: hypothetical protein GY919_16715, partial [Photobacterium aquimaris]|nr:hypothetical protein [Photobacterium aquimaris]